MDQTPALLKAFAKHGARDSSEKHWPRHIHEGSNKTRFECCEDSKNSLAYFRAVQGHSGGISIDRELVEYIQIPCNWKEFVFHRCCSFNINSILENGLMAGGKQSKEGRQAIFFTPLDPFGENPCDEEPSDDFTIPREVHCHSSWKHDLDAVYWVKLSRAQVSMRRLMTPHRTHTRIFSRQM